MGNDELIQRDLSSAPDKSKIDGVRCLSSYEGVEAGTEAVWFFELQK